MASTGDIKISEAQSLPLGRSESSNIKKVCIKHSRNPSRETIFLTGKVMFDYKCRLQSKSLSGLISYTNKILFFAYKSS